jgi:two-component system nitrate/nitrite response regulator NarL
MNQLTGREQEVVALVAEGLPDKLIARRLRITLGTTKLHLHNIYQKVGFSSRVKLALAHSRLGQPT